MFRKIYLKLNEYSFFNRLFNFIGKFSEKKLTVISAGISFYFFISVIPIAVLLCSQLPYTGISQETLVDAITKVTPASVHELVSSVISQAYSMKISVFSASVIFLIWSSSKLMLSLIRALDRIYSQDDSRSYVSTVARSVLYTVMLLLIIGVSLILISRRGVDKLIKIMLPANDALVEFAQKGYKIFIYIIITLFFALIYKLAPNGKRKYIYQLPGAAVSALVISIFSIGFTFYSQWHNIYVSFYGGLASIALFMVWIYACINIFLMGAVLNYEYKDVFENLFSKLKHRLSFHKTK